MVLAFGTHAEVDSFHYINKGFVLLVFDVGAAPTRGTSSLSGNL